MKNTNKTLIEIRAIVFDQIKRHVAAEQAHRDWLAQDISGRICALVDEERRRQMTALRKRSAALRECRRARDEWESEARLMRQRFEELGAHVAATPSVETKVLEKTRELAAMRRAREAPGATNPKMSEIIEEQRRLDEYHDQHDPAGRISFFG